MSDFFSNNPAVRLLFEIEKEQLPYPLAVTLAGLERELRNEEPIAAAWALKDAYEAALKFSACLAAAERIATFPNDEARKNIAIALFRPGGLALGHWLNILESALVPLPNHSEDAPRSLLLSNVFHKDPLRRQPSPILVAIKHSIPSQSRSELGFVPWRNAVFGHGVFRHDRRFYAEQTITWLPHLLEFYIGWNPHSAETGLMGAIES